MISHEFWSDEEVASWSDKAKLFYIGTWNFADDEGRFRAVPKLLRAQIFPYDIEVDMEKVMDETKSKILYYEDRGQKYGWVKNFKKHQYLSKKIPSRLPAPPSMEESYKRDGQGTSETREEREESGINIHTEVDKVVDGKISEQQIPKQNKPNEKTDEVQSRKDIFFNSITQQEKQKGNLIWAAISKCTKLKIVFDDKSKQMVIQWIRTYPEKNIPSEILRADNWLLVSGKGYENGLRFFNGWIGRSQTGNVINKGRTDNSTDSAQSNNSKPSNIEGKIGKGTEELRQSIGDI